MDGFWQVLLAPILGANNPAVSALLLLIAGALGFIAWKIQAEAKKERNELITNFQKQLDDDRQDLLEVIDKYQQGQMSVVEALNELKVLIATIGAKM